MNLETRICVQDNNGTLRSCLWISLQEKDSAISIGFTDRTFTFPGLGSQEELKALIECPNLTSTPTALINPHFTLHPTDPPGPCYFHLQNKEKIEIVAGLVGAHPDALSGDSDPWIRFISNRVSELKVFSGAASGVEPRILILRAPSGNNSIQVNFDFARRPGHSKVNSHKVSEFIEWRGIILHCYAFAVPAQASRLGYVILS
jgi:hypothetical protein